MILLSSGYMKAKYPSDYIVWTDIQIIIAGNNFVMLIYVAGEKRQSCRRGTEGKGKRANRRRNYGNKIQEVLMVDRQEIGRVPDSDDEDAKKDLELKCKMNLEEGGRVARENQQKGRRIWHAIKHIPEDRRLHIRDILDLAVKENVPQVHHPPAEQQVSAQLTPMKSSTSSSATAILQYHQKKRRLCLQKNKTSTSTKSTGAATSTTLPLGHSQERQNLVVTAGAIRASTAIDLDPPDDISFTDNFLFEEDFTD